MIYDGEGLRRKFEIIFRFGISDLFSKLLLGGIGYRSDCVGLYINLMS